MANLVSPSKILNSEEDPEKGHENQNGAEGEEEEEDYMTMTIPSPPTSPRKETFTQRRKRQQREAESRAHQPSKAELSRRETLARDQALSTALSTETSKGFRMMAKLGYKSGDKLGAEGNVNALEVPLALDVKEGKGGVGMDGERKRKIREEWERQEAEIAGREKRAKVEEGDFRDRVGREREERRVDGMWWGAMKIMEGLEEDGEKEVEEEGDGKTKKRRKQVNVLVRPLVKEREDHETERRARYDLIQSLSRDRKYYADDPEDDEQDRLAFGVVETATAAAADDEDGGKEDEEELEEYLSAEPRERLRRLVTYLRERYWYCFWCKSRYETEDMDGCPGVEEDDHD